MQGKYKSGIHCLNQIIKNEGFFALYKGCLSPIIGSSFSLTLFYGFDNIFKKIIKNYSDYTEPLPYKIIFISSFIAS